MNTYANISFEVWPRRSMKVTKGHFYVYFNLHLHSYGLLFALVYIGIAGEDIISAFKWTNFFGSNTDKNPWINVKNNVGNKWSKLLNGKAIWGAMEQSLILLSQYWKNLPFYCAPKVISHFVCTSNIFVDYFSSCFNFFVVISLNKNISLVSLFGPQNIEKRVSLRFLHFWL